MTNLIFDGEKFALIAFETRSAVDLPLTELTPGLWASSASMIDLGQFWKDELGKNRTRDFHCCTLFLLVKDQATDPAVDQRLRDHVWQFYNGMLLADRYGTDQVPFFITGDIGPDGTNVRSVDPLEPLRHAPADRWRRLSNDQVRRGAEIGQAIQNFPWIGAHRLNRVLSLYREARALLDWMDRIHQYTRCLDGLTVPPGGGTGKKFADRMALVVGPAHRDLFEEIYAIRGAIEHLRENDYTEPFDRVGRLGLIKKASIVEYVARSSLVRILETKSLWPYFKTTIPDGILGLAACRSGKLVGSAHRPDGRNCRLRRGTILRCRPRFPGNTATADFPSLNGRANFECTSDGPGVATLDRREQRNKALRESTITRPYIHPYWVEPDRVVILRVRYGA